MTKYMILFILLISLCDWGCQVAPAPRSYCKEKTGHEEVVMKEIWKDISGYEGYYQVSNIGRIKSLTRYVKSKNNRLRKCNGKIKKIRKDKDGYLIITLHKKGVFKTKKVHRLVAQAFIPNPENKPEINHIDANKRNNKVENLEHVTSKENHRHASIMKLNVFGEKVNTAKLKKIDIIDIRKSKLSNKEIAEKYQVHISTVCRIKKRESWKHII